jgi:NADH-quinone oxidoreductase subunit L
MHGMNDEVNMRKYGALRAAMPLTAITFGLGYLAIIGIPPFAGFYSKDKLIEVALNAGGIKGLLLGGAALIGAGITAFYMTRVVVLTFAGKARWDHEAHPHESPALMVIPMILLAFGSVASGYLFTRGDALVKWLEPVVAPHHGEHHEELYSPLTISVVALTLVAIGVLTAVLKYRGEVSNSAPENVSIFTRIARRDLLQDSFNEAVFMRPGQSLTKTLLKVDQSAIDGTVRAVAASALGSAQGLRKLQSGFVRSYAAVILGGVVALLLVIWVVTQ